MSADGLKGKGGLENMIPSASMAKSVDDTKMLDPIAREHKDHISGDNDLGEYDSGKANFGQLGHRPSKK